MVKGNRSRMVRGWPRSHVIVTLAATLVLGVACSAPEENSTANAQLVTAQEEAQAAASQAERLEAQNAELQIEIEGLQEQILHLNAKRRLPKMTNGTEDDATALAEQFGWNVRVRRRYSTASAGSILSQLPSPGTMMRYEALVTIVVAKKIPKAPDVIGLRKGRAVDAVKQAGYRVAISHELSTEKPGTVIAMSPGGGTRLIPGNTLSITIAKKAPPPPPTPPPPPEPNCTPGYDPCLPPASDYDCLGGSGDGPKYTGPVRVTGSDPYGLDADGDGLGCE
jgi:hypothetical protein